MMQQVRLADSGLLVSRVGVGLSRLHHLYFESDRRRFFDAAIDLGFTHFDAARLYGDGLAERSLGKALGSRRSTLTIASKFGLTPTDWVGALGFAARPIWAARPILRRAGLSRWARRSFSADAFRQCLAASLRHLRTDYLDIYFLHEPTAADINDELVVAMQDAKSRGAIRHIGLSGWNLSPIVDRLPGVFDVLQMPENAWADELVPDISFSVLTGQPNGTRSPDDAGQAIQRALSRRPNGAVLVGTTKTDRLAAIARLIDGGAVH